ncbi:MAG: DNA-deoxyinosine glycosylase [Methanomicrobiaceae archaeon]|nr:DNA-deoxyinosine glycosylase [Methanomicrobiaceae archaeon]
MTDGSGGPAPPEDEKRRHGLPPVAGSGARVLILGSFPSEQSLERGEYYANPRNQFWHVMEALFAIDRTLPYGERTAALVDRGVALWDVVASCRRAGSSDAAIRDAEANDIAGFLDRHRRVRHIALNGTTGAEIQLRRHNPGIFSLPGITIATYPSTSPANARYTLAEKVAAWEEICGFL